MMAGMGSIMYIFIIIGIVCLILSGYKLMHFYGSNAEEGYNILRFTKDSVTINTGLFPPTYKLKDIAEVRFSKGLARGRISTSRYIGYLQVIKTNGHSGRLISFDGSVYYRFVVIITNERIIDLSTEILMNEFRQRGILCIKE